MNNAVLDRESSRKKLVKQITDMESQLRELHKKLGKLTKRGETFQVVTLHVNDKFLCRYESIKGTKSTRLVRIEDGETIQIPLTESQGYCRLGKTKTYVPRYLVLEKR